jgi:hypothetical protein
MDTRYSFIEKSLRQIYGNQPSDDTNISYNLVNKWLNIGIGLAAKQNYKDSIAIDGCSYINNSFYTTFKGLPIVSDENFTFKITLPQIPLGIGRDEGISTIEFKDSKNNVSPPAIPLSANQRQYFKSMRPIPNKVLYYPEGLFAYAITTLPLTNFTASVSMVSGGDSTDLNSLLNVPDDYHSVITDYIRVQLGIMRAAKEDLVNDGNDLPTT